MEIIRLNVETENDLLARLEKQCCFMFGQGTIKECNSCHNLLFRTIYTE